MRALMASTVALLIGCATVAPQASVAYAARDFRLQGTRGGMPIESMAYVAQGTKLTLLEARRGFFHVQLDDGRVGWVPFAYTSRVPVPPLE